MLRGNYPARVDDKGRLKIPATYLEEFRQHGGQFYITSTTGESAIIYPMHIWNEVEEKLAKISPHNRAKKKFLARTNYFGQVVELDGQGRVLLPTVLREAAHMKGEVAVLGNLTHLEVWNQSRYLENLKNNPLTEDDEKDLESLGI